MQGDVYTVIIASNGVGPTRRYYIPASWVKATAFLTFLFVLLASAVSIDYVGLLPKGREHARLTAENKTLKKQSENLRELLQFKLGEVGKFKSLIEKLKKITSLDSTATAAAAALTATANAGAVTADDGGLEVPEEVNVPVREPAALAAAVAAFSEPLSIVRLADETLSEAQKREQEMATMWDLLSDRQNFLSATPTLKPTNGYYSSRFGLRIHPISGRTLLHAGVDIAAPYGSQVIATAEGVVSYAGYENGYGNVVSIDHGYGVLTRYGHNSKIFVRTGQKVRRWDVIAAVGSTGHSTGSHVHYEVIVRGMPVDPMNYILQDK